ncbi:hypothetical protein K474DRAFT_1657232 [Panus rudis PR-1116 ss-1]|nr:hypothetical protein K474DRAFT_1657232 [Panus rudis PR-1116 ss-1]
MPTKRRAWVKVRNETGKPMLGISLIHKYSNVYKEEKQYETLDVGATTNDPLGVDYNTGFLTTGRDWWFISWFHPDMKYIWFGSPNNMRGFFDFADNLLPEAIAGAAGGVAGLGTSATGPGAAVAGAAAAGAAKLVTSALFNSESTEGFKQHILTEEDEGELMEIIVHLSEVEFRSKSGTSTTNVRGLDAPKKKF